MLREMWRANPAGWLIAIMTFGALSLVFSARSSLGLMMPIWEQELGWARSFISTGGAIMLTVMAVVSPLAGNLLDRVGPRAIYAGGLLFIAAALGLTSLMSTQWQFIVLFSVIGGIGFGAVSVPLATTTIALYFERYRGLAMGFATSGASGGQLLIVPLLALLVVLFGWRSSFALFALVMAVMAVLAWVAVRRRATSDAPARHAGPRREPLSARLRALRRSRTFWLLFGGFSICGFTTTGVIEVHLLPYAATRGFSPLLAATAFGVLSAFNMAGMMACGYLADRVNRPLLLAGIYLVRALTFLLLIYVGTDPTLLFIFAVIFGLVDYSTMPVIASIVASHIGIRVMGLTLGILFAGHSLGAATGALAGGYLFDLFAGYGWVWIISLVLALAAAFMSFCIREGRPETAIPVAATA
jgi:MFS family permease